MRVEYIRRADAMGKITSSETQKALRTMTGEEAYVTVVGILNELPAADVLPMVHGRWSDASFGELPKHAPYGWACSVCGGISFNNEYIYCPNCGARMDGAT